MARPKKLIARTHEIKFRCTPFEKATIEVKAQNAGLKVAEFARATALEKKITYKLTDEELEAYKTLTEFKSNFNRIGNLIKSQSDIREEAKTLIKLLEEHLKKFA